MASPNKRRKLNDTKVSQPGRNLDFFFGKQRKDTEAGASKIKLEKKEEDSTDLTDEQLARKLQAEWDYEASGASSTPNTNVGGESKSGDTSEKDETEDDIYGLDDIKMLENPSSVANKAPPASISGSKNTLSLQSTGSAEDTITSTIPFDESPLIFEPSKYIGDLQKHWDAEGGDASYALLTRCFVLVNSTQSRIKIVDTLVNLLRTIIEGDPSSLLPTVRIKLILHPSGLFPCTFVSSLPFIRTNFALQFVSEQSRYNGKLEQVHMLTRVSRCGLQRMPFRRRTSP